jgi:RNA polymerase sigma factor (sigma-70 family)
MSDRDALEALCRREHPRLVRSLALYTGDALLAEEFAQEALMAACRRWTEVQRMTSPGAWLHRVALNAAHTHFRRRRAEHRALQRRRDGAQAAYELPDSATAIALRAALDRLPDRQRAVLVLRYLAELDVAETAEVLGISRDAVRSLTHRAITTLRSAQSHEFSSGERSHEPGEVSGAN